MSQKLPTNSYTGTRDFYPQDMRFRSHMFSLIEEAVSSFSYEKISGPLLESFDIFAAKSGEEIAEQQLYVFTDKGDRKVAIRPELTPTVARMYAAKIGDMSSIQRWFSIENFMRYERPQKGRLREFYQVNVDLIGAKGSFADFELLRVAHSIFSIFEATTDMYEIKINHRQFLKDVLMDFVGIPEFKLLAISKIIDKKDKISKEKFVELFVAEGFGENHVNKIQKVFAMNFEDASNLVPDSQGAKELKEILELGAKIFKTQNPLRYDFSIVRGLAYYTGLVFEAYDKNPENPRALFGGGRYDDLVGVFHKNSEVSGVGFAIGDVTFESFLRGHKLLLDEDLVVERHMIAIDAYLPLSMFHTVSDHLKEMEHVFLDCVGMLENIVISHANNKDLMKDSITKVTSLLEKNPFFDKEKDGNFDFELDLLNFLGHSKSKKYSVEIYPDMNMNLGKQLQYANRANVKYVWIGGEPELKKGIMKRKSMKTGTEIEFDLKTFELY